MGKAVKWEIYSVEQYSAVLGSNSQPNHGMSIFDVAQLIETEEGSDEFTPTGKHVSVAIPVSDLNAALALPTNAEKQTYIREILAWQLEPWGTVSPNIDSEKYDKAIIDVNAFNQLVADTWGGYPIRFSLPT